MVTERDERCIATEKDEGLGDRSEISNVDIEVEEEDMIIEMTLTPLSSLQVDHDTSFLLFSTCTTGHHPASSHNRPL